MQWRNKLACFSCKNMCAEKDFFKCPLLKKVSYSIHNFFCFSVKFAAKKSKKVHNLIDGQFDISFLT
jgi:hypothetical protein